MAKRKTARTTSSSKTSARSTVSGPARKAGGKFADALVAKIDAVEALAAAMPYNENKEGEHGELATEPQRGKTVEPEDSAATGSTLSETNATEKTGKIRLGLNPGNLPLDRVRTDSGGRMLTTNQVRTGRRQPELAQVRAARPDAHGGLHPPREDHPLRPRAHSGAHRACQRIGRLRVFRDL